VIEAALALFVFIAASLGIGLGLVLGRGPAKTSCGAAACLPEGRCADCPLARRSAAEADG
jgi:hypothetical protein